MPEAISHHLLEPELHILVATDHIAREARYLTRYDDGTETETVHMLYWETNPKELPPGGEVRSMPIEEWPVAGAATLTADEPLTFDVIVGTDVANLPAEARDLLRLFGGIGIDGRVRAVGTWTT